MARNKTDKASPSAFAAAPSFSGYYQGGGAVHYTGEADDLVVCKRLAEQAAKTAPVRNLFELSIMNSLP